MQCAYLKLKDLMFDRFIIILFEFGFYCLKVLYFGYNIM